MKAFLSLVIVSFVLAGCNKPPAEEFMKKAADAEKAGLWTVAAENYQQLAKEHPGSPLCETALFNIAAIQHNNLQNFPAAIDSYKKFYDKYPEAKKAPTALFLAAFLYHNELKNLDSAKACYERFLARFPDNEMAASAQFELQNLGKSPDEILPKPAVAESAPAKTPAKPAGKAKKN